MVKLRSIKLIFLDRDASQPSLNTIYTKVLVCGAVRKMLAWMILSLKETDCWPSFPKNLSIPLKWLAPLDLTLVPVGMAKGSTLQLNIQLLCFNILAYFLWLLILMFYFSTSTCVCLYLYVQGIAGKDGDPGLQGAVGRKVLSSTWIVSWLEWDTWNSHRPSPSCFLWFSTEGDADINRTERKATHQFSGQFLNCHI